VIAIAWLVLALALAPAGSAAAADLADAVARGTLRVIVDRDTHPEALNLKPNGAPGLEREMLDAFAALYHLKVELVVVATGGDRIPALLGGKGELIAGAFGISEERRKQMDFTVEVFPAHYVVVTRRPHARIDTPEDLRRTRVGTMKWSSWAETIAAAGVPRENVDDSFVNVDEVMAALRAGKVAAVVMGTGFALVEAKKDPQLEIGLVVGRGIRAWALRKDSPKLLQALDDYIINVRRTPTWSRLVVKYYGEVALDLLRKTRDEQ
jgi:ABC-type amino acid transport substrate-binding protein